LKLGYSISLISELQAAVFLDITVATAAHCAQHIDHRIALVDPGLS
jgi:hypothetical protein